MGGTINEQFPVGVTKTMVLEGQLRRVTAERDQLRAELAAAKDRGDGLYLGLRQTLEALGGVAQPGVSEAFLILGVPGEAAAIKRLNNTLAADNARLRKDMEEIHECCIEWLASSQDVRVGMESVQGVTIAALAASADQSLAAHDAAVKVAVLREVAGKLAEMCKKLERTRTHQITWEACEEWILAEADRIEKEAANG